MILFLIVPFDKRYDYIYKNTLIHICQASHECLTLALVSSAFRTIRTKEILILISNPNIDWGSKRTEKILEYQPSTTGGTCSPPATLHRLKHLTARFNQNGQQGPKIG